MPINIIRFDVTDGNRQTFNYIPLIKNGATKVFVNYAINIDQPEIDQMKSKDLNQLKMQASFGKEWHIKKTADIPLDQITQSYFISLSLTFTIEHSQMLKESNYLKTSLAYIDTTGNHSLFETNIPVKEVEHEQKQYF